MEPPEPFLPSEIARLVYGYLEESQCNEAAHTFLEQSPHLSECLAVYKKRKGFGSQGFNTRHDGYSLNDILYEYCEIRRLVAERLQKLPENSAQKLRESGSLVGQLRYLIDATKSGQTLLVSITVPPQVPGSSAQGSSSSQTSILSSSRTKTRLLNSPEKTKRSLARLGQDSDQQHSKDLEDRLALSSSSMLPVEATPLESLPGLSGSHDIQDAEALHEGGSKHDSEVEECI